MTPTAEKTTKNNNTCVGVLLAAGQGKRMCTQLPKVAHTLLGKPMIVWAAESMLHAGIKSLVIVISPQQKIVEEIIKSTKFPEGCTIRIAYQDKANGTGHATACAMPTLREIVADIGINPEEVHVMVGFGDVPAISSSALTSYFSEHVKSKNACTVLAFRAANPTGYGRVLTGATGQFKAIREEKDCSPEQKSVHLCNSGFLCSTLKDIETYLPQLKPNNAAGEYYLTDVPGLAVAQNKNVGVFSDVTQEELEGVNSQSQLAAMAKYLQDRIIKRWMDEGVQFLMPHCVYLEPTVTFEANVIVEPFTYLSGNIHIKSSTRITSGTRMIGE